MVRVDRMTDEATIIEERTIRVSAMDTCPPQTTQPPGCVDRVFVGSPPIHGDGYFVQVESNPLNPNMMLLTGYGILFVDGGEPGTAPAGPPFPGGAGIVPTQDYGQFVGSPSAAELRLYFVTGGVQITGTG